MRRNETQSQTAQMLQPGLRLLRAPNPSPMTFTGTNTYLLGTQQIAVIDPGPDLDAHLAAILDAVPDGARISHILVTHSHVDHSALVPRLARETGAPVYAFGDSYAGRSEIMQSLSLDGVLAGGEGFDASFAPDECLADGAALSCKEWTLEALWTPGHFGNHLCFRWGDVVFSGDLVMGWATSIVSPPDGDLTDFMASCERLADLAPKRLYPGHGDPVEEPVARVRWLIAHRREREAQILATLKVRPASIQALTAQIYKDVDPALLPMAERNVFAHLIDLIRRNQVDADPMLAADAVFQLR